MSALLKSEVQQINTLSSLHVGVGEIMNTVMHNVGVGEIMNGCTAYDM